MEYTFTFNGDELTRIRLAIIDKITSIKQSAISLGGYNNIPRALKRKQEYEELLKKLFS
ncbi:hypothetical protein [Phocaeicola plebeius]|jgi:hypothetical protein